MSSQPKLSIITINYNGFQDTCELIDSVERHLKLCYELIVVDNGSKENEAQRIQEIYPAVRVIASPLNLGFSGGNNLGIKASCGDYLLFLNNDTIVEDDTIHFLVDCLDANPEIGGVSPKIKFNFEPRSVQFAGFTELSSVTLRNQVIGYDCVDDGRYDTGKRTPYLHGAAMMIRREVIERVGLMPEIYFLYYEELDWSSAMTNNGFILWYEPRCTIFHKESRSTGVDTPLKAYYLTRNRLLYATRHRRGVKKGISILYQLTIAVPKGIVMYLIQGKIQQAKAVGRGAINYLNSFK